MDACLFDGSEHTDLLAFFRQSHTSHGEAHDLHDGHDEPEQSNESRISASKQDDLPLQLSNVFLAHVKRDDLGMLRPWIEGLRSPER